MFIDDVFSSEIVKKEIEEHGFLAYWPPPHVTVFQIQNVFDYIAKRDDRDVFKLEDFNNVAPPAPTMWFEFSDNNAKVIRAHENNRIDTARIKCGILVLSMEVKQDNQPNLRWKSVCLVFSKIIEPDKNIHFSGLVSYKVLSDGKPELYDERFQGGPSLALAELYPKETLSQMVVQKIKYPWMALSFIHCKNVRTVAGEPIPPKLQAARKAKGKLPLFRHHTIVIDPIGGKKQGIGGEKTEGTGMPLHICRGHFKNFTEKKLFGKYSGTYWWPMTTRGSIEKGEVAKDYKLASPKTP